jgi:hypothetical protein
MKKRSNLILPYLIIFFFFFFPLILYEMNNVEKYKEKKLNELKQKSLILDQEYEELKKLVQKYGTKKEMLNASKN